MIDASEAFRDFKSLATGLTEWGYDLRQDDDFGEFGFRGYLCSYRFFDVLDIQFLKPGQTLQLNHEPDMVLTWDGEAWHDIFDGGSPPRRFSTEQLFTSCLRTVNFIVSMPVGFDPRYCLLASTSFLENQTSG